MGFLFLHFKSSSDSDSVSVYMSSGLTERPSKCVRCKISPMPGDDLLQLICEFSLCPDAIRIELRTGHRHRLAYI